MPSMPKLHVGFMAKATGAMFVLLAASTSAAVLEETYGSQIAAKLLASANPQLQIRAVLQQQRNSSLSQAASVAALRQETKLMLSHLHLEAAIDSNPSSVDAITGTLNDMIASTRWDLEQKVLECRSQPETIKAAALSATQDVQGFAAEIGHLRARMLQAADESPENTWWFRELKTQVRLGRRACEKEQISFDSKAAALREENKLIQAIGEAVRGLCENPALLQYNDRGGATNLLKRTGHQRTGKPRALSVQRAHAGRVRLWAALSRSRPRHAGSRRAGRHKASHRSLPLHSLLRRLTGRRGSRVSTDFCARVRDAAAELAGELADKEARLKADVFASQRACKNEEGFAHNQMVSASHRLADLSHQMAQANSELGGLTAHSRQRDSERQKLNEKALSVASHCRQEVDRILHGKLCGLQRLRDGLWLLAGRNTLPVDCEVAEWVEEACTASCDGGEQTSTREVLLPASNGAGCPPLKMSRPCGQAKCPRNCVISMWSGWSACSSDCDGGLQERTRGVITKARGGGDPCPRLVDLRSCNTRACSRDCVLGAWAEWSLCSQACGGGTLRSRRRVQLGAAGDGTCPAEDSDARLRLAPCNAHACPAGAAVTCQGAPLDVVLLLDASGSMGEAGFGYLRSLAAELVNRYAAGVATARIGAVTFARWAQVVSPLERDAPTLQARLSSGLAWAQGASMLSRGLLSAGQVLSGNSVAVAAPTVVVLTDGHLADPFLAGQVATRIRAQGTRLLFVLVNPGYKERNLIKRLASSPLRENLIEVPSMQDLGQNVSEVAGSILVRTCSTVQST